jgi:Mce-associated membrane protein
MTRRGSSPPAPVWEDGVVDEDFPTETDGRPTEVLPAADDDDHPTTVLDAAEDTEAEPVSGTDDGGAVSDDRPLRGRGLFGLIALLVVTVLLLAAAVTAGVFWAKGSGTDAHRENALSAARATAVNLTSIDFSHAEEDVRRVLDGSTGDFGGLFTQNLDSYVGVVKEGEVVTTGEVAEAGIEKFDGDTASAVVAVKTTVKNKTVPQGEQRFYRLVEQLEYQDGRWLVSRVEFVP